MEQAPAVQLVDFDPDAEDKLLAAICYPLTHLPEQQVMERVKTLGPTERLALLKAYVGDRENRRHKPGRAFERVDYRFDVLSDYGAFRDLQRHRPAVRSAGCSAARSSSMRRSSRPTSPA